MLQMDEARRCGTPTDIWSCGVVLYICLCGFPPFSDELKRPDFPYSLVEQIRGAMFDYPSPYWDLVSEDALDLIDRMLVVDMDERLNIKECLRHWWLVRGLLTVFERGEDMRTVSPELVEVQW
jgi:serine/threonine-protein kinase Chk2